MAVTVELLLLLTLISNNIQADIIQVEGWSHHFILDETSDFCFISRWTGEEKTLLGNSSVIQDSRYVISNLKVSDSGQYQEQCWTQNNVTHERNFTLLVCDDHSKGYQTVFIKGQTAELTCEGLGPNQSAQWFIDYKNHTTGNWELTSIVDETSSDDKLQLLKTNSSLRITNKKYDLITFFCLEKNHQSCDVLSEYEVIILAEFILRSVEESLELNCSDVSGNQTHVWNIRNSVMNDESENYTLMFPSLTLNHTGIYTCELSDLRSENYYLFVCPKSQPAVVFFTEGENVTLQCDWKQNYHDIKWLMKSNRSEGKPFYAKKVYQLDNMHVPDELLVITNISLEDSGEFWCVVEKDERCVFSSKTLVMFQEPEVDHHQARSVLLCVVILIMCVVVVATVWRSRRREQLQVPVEELEMSDLTQSAERQ